MMNSLGQQLILWRTVLKMFFFSVNEILSRQKALMDGLRGIWPITAARWICLFPGNATWGSASWSVTQGASEALWSRQARRAASGQHGFRRAEPPAPRAVSCKSHQNHRVQKKCAHIRKNIGRLGLWNKAKGCETKQRAVNLFLSELTNTKSGSCFPRAWRGLTTEIRSDPHSSS